MRLLRASSLSTAALMIACLGQEAQDSKKSDDGSGATNAAGAVAGMPAAVGGGAGTIAQMGGAAGTTVGAAGVGGTADLAGMPGVGGALPSVGGTGGDPSGGLGGGGGIAASDGGAPMAGTGSSVGGASGSGTGGDLGAGTGGSAGSVVAGMGGSGGSVPGCSDGCAELSVPFTAWKAGQYFEIYLNSSTDMSAMVINVKARKVSGKAGGMLIVVKDGSADNYAYAQNAWASINDMTTEFATYTFDVAAPDATDQNNTFNPAAVAIVTIQLAAGDPWYTDPEETMEDPTALVNPTVIQIDEITVTGTGTLPGPWLFTSDASSLKATITEDGLMATPPYAVTGSTVTWIAP